MAALSATSSSSLVLLLLSVLVFSNHRMVHVRGDGTLIKFVCLKTRDPQFCVSTLIFDPRSSTADMHGLAKISLLIGQDKASEAEAHVTEMLDNATRSGGDPRLISGLEGCKHGYAEATKDFGDALKDFDAKAYSEASQAAGYASDEPPQCELAISKGSAIPFPPELATRGEAVIKLSDLGSDLVGLLKA